MLKISNITSDFDTYKIAEIKDRSSYEIKIFFEPTEYAKPGYYQIQLYSDNADFDVKEIKYLAGEPIRYITWRLLVAGWTWVELEKGSTVKDVFKVRIKYIPFAVVVEGNILIEERLFQEANQARVAHAVRILDKAADNVYSLAKSRVISMIHEGKVVSSPLGPVYEEILFTGNYYNALDNDKVAKDFYLKWSSSEEDRNKMYSESSSAVAVFYGASKDTYYILLLFVKQK